MPTSTNHATVIAPRSKRCPTGEDVGGPPPTHASPLPLRPCSLVAARPPAHADFVGAAPASPPSVLLLGGRDATRLATARRC